MTDEEQFLATLHGYDRAIIKDALVALRYKIWEMKLEINNERPFEDRVLTVKANLDRLGRIEEMLERLQ